MTTESSTNTTSAAADASCEAMGALAPQHELLKPFAGTFNSEVKIWMGPGEPMVMTGTMENSLDLGGRFLKQVYASNTPMDECGTVFEGRGFWVSTPRPGSSKVSGSTTRARS